MKKVVVTGASGFIGRHVIEKLANLGYEVHAFYNSSTPAVEIKNGFWHKVDLLNQNEVEDIFAQVKPSHLLHLAWDVKPGFRDSTSNFDWVVASLDILFNFKKNGGKRVVFAGTCFQYELLNGVYNEETTLKNPFYVYGFCKQKLQDLFEKYIQKEGISGAWGYVFYPYGEGDLPNKLISQLINSLLENKPFECSSGEQIRDYVYVKDVANAFVRLLDSDVQGGFNIASGQGVSVKDIVLTVGNLLQKTELLNIGKIAQYSNEPDKIIGDISKIQEYIGWQPEFDLDSGLRETIEFYAKTKDGDSIVS